MIENKEYTAICSKNCADSQRYFKESIVLWGYGRVKPNLRHVYVHTRQWVYLVSPGSEPDYFCPPDEHDAKPTEIQAHMGTWDFCPYCGAELIIIEKEN